MYFACNAFWASKRLHNWPRQAKTYNETDPRPRNRRNILTWLTETTCEQFSIGGQAASPRKAEKSQRKCRKSTSDSLWLVLVPIWQRFADSRQFQGVDPGEKGAGAGWKIRFWERGLRTSIDLFVKVKFFAKSAPECASVCLSASWFSCTLIKVVLQLSCNKDLPLAGKLY